MNSSCTASNNGVKFRQNNYDSFDININPEIFNIVCVMRIV